MKISKEQDLKYAVADLKDAKELLVLIGGRRGEVSKHFRTSLQIIISAAKEHISRFKK